MNPTQPSAPAPGFPEQELRMALVMNGGVSLAVWIGGVAHEINRMVRGETVYGRLCQALALRPRVDIISGTSAGGINGALLALAASEGKPLDPLRDLWLNRGDILTLLRKPGDDDPPSLLDGGYFYQAMVEGFRSVQNQIGKGLQPPDRVPIELTLTTTVLCGEVRNFPDDAGTLIQDISHRGLIQFRRGPDIAGDPFAEADIALKLATAARATASFPVAFEPFYLPAGDERVKVGADKVPCLQGHTNFNTEWKDGRFVVDGGVLDNSPLESAIDAVFRQRAEGEVRRVMGYIVPDPGRIPDPPPQEREHIPAMLNTALDALVNLPRVESVSEQLRAVSQHNQAVSRKRDSRLLIARSLDWTMATHVAEAVFPSYRIRRAHSAADYIALSLAEGAAHPDTGDGVALGRRTRERLADVLVTQNHLPWLPDGLFYGDTDAEWDWGLFTLENIFVTALDLLRRAVGVMAVQSIESTAESMESALWQRLKDARRQAYDLLAVLVEMRHRDHGHWVRRGRKLAPLLADFERGVDTHRLPELLEVELREWVRMFDPDVAPGESLRPPRAFTRLAENIANLLLTSKPLLRDVLALGMPSQRLERYVELRTLFDFLLSETPPSVLSPQDVLQRLLTLEVVHYAFGADTTQDQYLELIQFSANVPTAFGGPSRVEQKLAGLQVAHFGAFYKRSWRINDWMFGRLDGSERLVHILLEPRRLALLYGSTASPAAAIDAVLKLLYGAVFDGIVRTDDRAFLQVRWDQRLPAMEQELLFLADPDNVPEQLPQCASMVLERLHLDIIREELPALADAVRADEIDGVNPRSNGPKFLRCFQDSLCAGYQRSKVSPMADAPDLAPERLVQLFKNARVGEESIAEELGTDRFTLTTTRSAAVVVAALSGKFSGFKLLNGVFAVARAPLLALDILVRALMNKGRAFVSLFAVVMAVFATVLVSNAVAEAQWSSTVTSIAAFVLAVGFLFLLRHHLKLYVLLIAVVLILWLAVPFILNGLGS